MAKSKPGKGQQPAPRESFEERMASRLAVAGRLCTQVENEACMTIVMNVAAGDLTETEAQERIQAILHPEVPF